MEAQITAELESGKVAKVAEAPFSKSRANAGVSPRSIIGVLTSLISAYYYLRVVVIMYMRDGDPEAERESFLDLTTIATAVATVVISLVPQFLFAWAYSATLMLF